MSALAFWPLWLSLPRDCSKSPDSLQARYRAVLPALEAELRQLPFCHLKEQLASVIDPVKSAVFNDIIY